ncbi:glycosyltransferase family 9 protein [Desulfovibrio sp. OttesenSCG-928-G11]|nr:glycosyltransferase family 9 protein [Desulfovibrio sp. OttesenSCG-928-G11]
MLLATGLLGGLRSACPQAVISVITSNANAVVLPLLRPEFETYPFALTDIRGMLAHLRQRRYDLLIDTSQWARLGALLSFFSGARVSVGFATPGQYRHYAYTHAVFHSANRHETENFLALGKVLAPGLSHKPEIAVPPSLSEACPVLPDSPYVFFHMWPAGLASHLKEWPPDYWADMAQRLTASGYTVLLTGGKADREPTDDFLARHIPESLRISAKVRSVAGRMSLPDLAWAFCRAAAVVSVNTGIMHLAALCDAPLVALHGPTNPQRWGPLGQRSRVLLPDSGRCAYLNLGFEYPPDADCVMRHLPVEKVMHALRDFGVA